MSSTAPIIIATRIVSLAGMLGLLAVPVLEGRAQSDDANPFVITPSVIVSDDASWIAVAFHFPAHHHIYADRLSFALNDAPAAFSLPPAERIVDPFNQAGTSAYERDFRAVCAMPAGSNASVLAVDFQGCSDSECFFPETRRWRINADHSVVALNDDALPAASASAALTNGFHVVARATGFLSSQGLLGFLDQSEGKATKSADLSSRFTRFGLVATVGLILLGGMALNLTPCVLPMIPINLAILGAGTRNRNRRRGFLLGAAYGVGMSLAYGGLGLIVVLTGSKFGALNASPWFNFAIAIIFAVLGLAMFDKLAIDFSRFQRSSRQTQSSNGAFVAAGIMGLVSALLAGACVAPVVISVLLLATTLYQQGNVFGLLLPFVLGLGMALPWPFAAAGLTFLPKPGAWMTRVKYGFGVIIFGFAAWYGWLGWNLAGFGSSGLKLAAARDESVPELRRALEQSRHTGRAVFIDFWASWCKNCEAMEHSTFRDANVLQRLKANYIVVKFRAERLNDPALKPVLDEFGVMGLPTCVVLLPDSAAARSP